LAQPDHVLNENILNRFQYLVSCPTQSAKQTTENAVKTIPKPQNMRYKGVMKRYLDNEILEKWVLSVGGKTSAKKLIQSKIGCSESKAEKIAGGRYENGISAMEQAALAKLTAIPRYILFPVGAAKRVAS
jgi:hypothetical protein